jgi:hypothetical protein
MIHQLLSIVLSSILLNDVRTGAVTLSANEKKGLAWAIIITSLLTLLGYHARGLMYVTMNKTLCMAMVFNILAALSVLDNPDMTQTNLHIFNLVISLISLGVMAAMKRAVGRFF